MQNITLASREHNFSDRLRRSDIEYVECKFAASFGLSISDHLLECPHDRLQARLLLPRLQFQSNDHVHDQWGLDSAAILRYFKFTCHSLINQLAIFTYLFSNFSILLFVDASRVLFLLFSICQFSMELQHIILMICTYDI